VTIYPEGSPVLLLGKGSCLVGGSAHPLRLSDVEERCLKIFIDGKSRNQKELIEDSKVRHAPVVLARLRQKHPAFAAQIRCPGRRGQWGFFAAVAVVMKRR
jgi:hypothetical protein